MKGDSQRRQAAEGAKTRERVLEAYTEWIHTHGYAPSFDEVSEATDLSVRQIRRHVDILVGEGRLVQGRGHRAIGLG